MGRQAAVFAAVLALGTASLQAQDTLFTVTTASANVHLSPSTGSPVIGKATRGETFEVRRDLGSWVRVPWPESPDGVGYLHVTWGTTSHGGNAEPVRTAGTGAQPTSARLEPESVSSSATTMADQQPGMRPPQAAGVSLPSHLVGLGGRVGSQALGFAATGRGWSRGPYGVQVEVGRSTHTSVASTASLNAVQIAPSLIYSLPDVVTNLVWVRPYLGTGASVYRSTLSSVTPGVSDVVDNGLGYQAFGGAEFTWANLPQLAVSADLRRAWAPTPFSGFDLGGFGFSMSAHWYVK